MTAPEMASRFGARGPSRGPWRARCPVHGSRGLTLAIYPKADRTCLVCFAGCASDDVLIAVGLTWKDCYYQPRTKIDAKAQQEYRREREVAEKRASDIRIGVWIIRFARRGYTREDRDLDISALCACAIVLTNKAIPTWESILRRHNERILAAEHCMERGMLPEVVHTRPSFPCGDWNPPLTMEHFNPPYPTNPRTA